MTKLASVGLLLNSHRDLHCPLAHSHQSSIALTVTLKDLGFTVIQVHDLQ